MAISADWDIDFVNRYIRHIDGTINYDTNAGTAPSQFDYIRGTTSGAVAQILNGGDLGGTDASSTLVLTNTTAQFADNDPLDVLDVLYFGQMVRGMINRRRFT